MSDKLNEKDLTKVTGGRPHVTRDGSSGGNGGSAGSGGSGFGGFEGNGGDGIELVTCENCQRRMPSGVSCTCKFEYERPIPIGK